METPFHPEHRHDEPLTGSLAEELIRKVAVGFQNARHNFVEDKRHKRSRLRVLHQAQAAERNRLPALDDLHFGPIEIQNRVPFLIVRR